MKTISLLHTVHSVYLSFPALLRQEIPEEKLDIHNTLDEFLATDANRQGFTQSNFNRLMLLVKAAELQKPDVIVATCSTLTPWIEKIRPFVGVPLVAVDDAMCRLAVEQGGNVLVYATAQSTIKPTTAKLAEEARAQNRPVRVETLVCAQGFSALQQGNMPLHDQYVLDAAKSIRGVDTVVLAQASMAHLAPGIQALCGCRVLASPLLCAHQVKSIIFTKG